MNFVVATTGLSMTLHTCDMSKCKAAFVCSGKEDCKCCNTVIKYNRLTNDFNQVQHQYKINIPAKDFYVSIRKNLVEFTYEDSKGFYSDTSPPILKGELSFLQLFRI